MVTVAVGHLEVHVEVKVHEVGVQPHLFEHLEVGVQPHLFEHLEVGVQPHLFEHLEVAGDGWGHHHEVITTRSAVSASNRRPGRLCWPAVGGRSSASPSRGGGRTLRSRRRPHRDA